MAWNWIGRGWRGDWEQRREKLESETVEEGEVRLAKKREACKKIPEESKVKKTQYLKVHDMVRMLHESKVGWEVRSLDARWWAKSRIESVTPIERTHNLMMTQNYSELLYKAKGKVIKLSFRLNSWMNCRPWSPCLWFFVPDKIFVSNIRTYFVQFCSNVQKGLF